MDCQLPSNALADHGRHSLLPPAMIKPPQRTKGTRKAKPTPFDPEDLTRRLYIVLAEREAYADRKNRSRANIKRASVQIPVIGDNSENDRPKAVRGSTGAYDRKRGREVPLEIAVNEATASKSAQATAARRSVLEANAKRLSKDAAPEPPRPELPDKDDDMSALYHHVPRVAAAQFERTTMNEPGLSDDPSQVHKLSRPAMKFHMDGPITAVEASENTAAMSAVEQAKMVQRMWSLRQREYERNQFQHPAQFDNVALPVEAATDSEEKKRRQANRHTFDPYLRMRPSLNDEEDCTVGSYRLSSSDSRTLPPPAARMSLSMAMEGAGTGAYPVLSKSDSDNYDYPVRMDEHRIDWTQSDERSSKYISPALRKTGSKWTLRGRLSFHRLSSKAEKDALAVQEPSSPALKTSKSGFFSRFKR